jgi:hypothetical protein
LESFLALNSQFIGIVTPAGYLNAMGLQLIVDEEGSYSLAGGNPASGLNAAHTTTNYSVDDIVSRCYDTGYVTGTAPVNGNNHQGAFAAQPSIQANTNANANNGVATIATASIPGGGNVTGGNVAVATNSTANNGSIGGPNPPTGVGHVGANTNTNFAATVGNIPSPQQHAQAAQVQGMHNALQEHNIDAQYYGLFAPHRPPFYRYNPYHANGDWDAFDIDDFVNM